MIRVKLETGLRSSRSYVWHLRQTTEESEAGVDYMERACAQCSAGTRLIQLPPIRQTLRLVIRQMPD